MSDAARQALVASMASYSPLELLQMHTAAADELRARGFTRSGNNPVGDLAEGLFCRAFKWTQAPSSMPAADAIDGQHVRYQIKARRVVEHNGSRQLSAIRNLAAKGFDILAAVIFDRDYNIIRAALIPHSVVLKESRHQEHTNSALFMLRDAVWFIPGVRDVTAELRLATAAWSVL